jgi:hypothetical protein
MSEEVPPKSDKPPGRIAPWSLVRAFLLLTASPKNVQKLTSDQVIRYWSDSQKSTLRLWAVIACTLILFFGIKAATPNYNVVQFFANALPAGAEEVATLVRSALSADPPAKADPVMATQVTDRPKATPHGYVLIALFLMFYMIFTWADPMVNREYLQFLFNVGDPKTLTWHERASWLPELVYYAKDVLPSNRLVRPLPHFGCHVCFKKDFCDNRLTDASPTKVERWRALQVLLPPTELDQHLRALQISRLLFYSRYGLSLCAFFLFGIYIFLRLTEILSSELPVNWAPGLLVYVCVLLVVVAIIGRFNNATRPLKRGAWGSLRDSVTTLFDLPALKPAYVQTVCKHGGASFEFEEDWTSDGPAGAPVASRDPAVSAAALSQFLDGIVIKKLIRIIAGRAASSDSHGWLLANILMAMEQYFTAKHKGQVSVAAIVFAERDGELVQVGRRGAQDEPQRTLKLENQALMPCVAVSKQRAAFGRREGDMGCSFEIGVKSAVAYPLTTTRAIREAAHARGYFLPDVIGVVVTAANHEAVFQPRRESEICAALKFFATRLMFEMVSAATYSRNPPETSP